MLKRTLFLASIVTLSFLPGLIAASDIIELDEHLRFLEPVIGQQWEGGYVGENAPDLLITFRFEPIISGKAVKYTREAAAISFYSEMYFYWSPEREEVLFLNLNSRGMVGEGVASLQDGDIVLEGESHSSDGPTLFKTVLHISREGVLTDTFTGTKNGESVHGHIQEFTVKR